jgi:hypothetical protein
VAVAALVAFLVAAPATSASAAVTNYGGFLYGSGSQGLYYSARTKLQWPAPEEPGKQRVSSTVRLTLGRNAVNSATRCELTLRFHMMIHGTTEDWLSSSVTHDCKDILPAHGRVSTSFDIPAGGVIGWETSGTDASVQMSVKFFGYPGSNTTKTFSKETPITCVSTIIHPDTCDYH